MENELKQLHTLINTTWQILKRYFPKMVGKDKAGAEWDSILKECEDLSLKGDNEDIRELSKDIGIALYKYLGRVQAHNKKN